MTQKREMKNRSKRQTSPSSPPQEVLPVVHPVLPKQQEQRCTSPQYLDLFTEGLSRADKAARVEYVRCRGYEGRETNTIWAELFANF